MWRASGPSFQAFTTLGYSGFSIVYGPKGADARSLGQGTRPQESRFATWPRPEGGARIVLFDRHLDLHACMKETRKIQYTVRQIPEQVDQKLREVAATYGHSLNEEAIAAMARGLGLGDAPMVHHDLDDLAGTWDRDPAFEKALADMNKIDEELWK